ncbi:MAG TPA: TolC family protein, partial [Kofleriaceae bacterium]|nr:TolC family protein [Kofleriaceae bacterium]
LIDRAQRSQRARMAAADRDAAAARVDEADAARWAKVNATAFLAPSPEIRCVDASCIQTDPTELALRFSGVFGGAQASLTQPLYTFGKIDAARDAARAGLVAQGALADETAGDLALDAARAYWGLKLARELRYMLEDGVDQIKKAVDDLDQRSASGDGDVTPQDRQRVQVLLAEARAQLADAKAGEAQALASVRALAEDATVDIDEEPLEALSFEPGADDPAVARAEQQRPQVRAAKAGAEAARRLADLEERGYLPDLAAVASVTVTRAQGTDEPPGAFFYDPYNQLNGTLALGLRWNLEPWTTRAKVRRARAAERRAEALARLAVVGADLDARSALADARGAHEKLTAAEDGEQAARAWLAAVLQAEAIGTAEAKDLADAYIAWFQMRARVVAAIFQWNVAAMRIRRAAGEFSLPVVRPSSR